MLLLCALAAGAGGLSHAARQKSHRALSQYADRSFKAQKSDHPHSIAHNGYIVSRPPAPLGYLDAGLELAYGRWLRLDAHQTRPLQGARTAELLRAPGAGRFDLGLLLSVFAPALLVLLGFDQIAGEKVRGTWAMLLCAQSSASALALSKLAGLWTRTALALLLPATLVAILSYLWVGDGDPLRLLLWLLVHALALFVWGALILLVSALAHRPQNALLMSVSLWGLLALFVPPLAGGIAQALAPVPPPGEGMIKAAEWAESAHAQSESLRAAAIQDIKRRYPKWDGKSQPPEVIDAVMLRLADAEATGKMRSLFSQLDAEALRQAQLAAALAFVSPSGLVSLSSSALAGSDLAHMQASFRHFEAYRAQLMTWFNNWWAKNGQGGFEDYGTTKFTGFSDAPRPKAPRFSIGFALSRAALSLGLLLAMGVLSSLGLVLLIKRQILRPNLAHRGAR